MRRILPNVCPTVRITRGRSFGGITAKATMPTIIILLTSRSNMAHGPGAPTASITARRHRCRRKRPLRARRSADLVNVVRLDADAVLDRPGRRLSGLGLIVLGKPFLERFHALGDVAHEVGNLALAAEQQERNRAKQHP